MEIKPNKSKPEKIKNEIQDSDAHPDVKKTALDIKNTNREMKSPTNSELIGSEVNFAGMDLEQAKHLYLDRAGQLESKARELKSKANSLEREMNAKKEPHEKEKLRKQISSLRKEAKDLERSANSYKEHFKHAISFRGGFGISNIERLRASGLKADAERLLSRASSLESQAHRAEFEGNFGKASSFRSEASSCRREANNKIKEANRIETQLKKK